VTGFSDLQNRLIELIRAKLRNGELTERGLARRVGVSQPHLHNVLKRVRLLTTELADLLLAEMHLSLSDLLVEDDALPAHRPAAVPQMRPQREIPFLNGPVGPGHVWPRYALWDECYLFPTEEVDGLELPAFARLERDTRMEPLLDGCTLGLLDMWNGVEKVLQNAGYYVVRSGAECVIRRVNRGGRLLYLVAEDNTGLPEQWEAVSIPLGKLADVILARVVWAGKEPRAGTPLAYSGCFLGPMASK
jgi:hypothetical protein